MSKTYTMPPIHKNGISRDGLEANIPPISPVGQVVSESLQEYNFAHFQTKHLWEDAQRSLAKQGVAPGMEAPDFELPRAQGATLRLSDLRGKPVLLHFGSYS